MIRHRPFGRGHPYLVEPDQRVPVQPLAGEVFDLRATANPVIDSVVVEGELDGRRFTVGASRRGPARAEQVPNPGVAGDGADGHLAAAQTRSATGSRIAWAAELAPLPFGASLRYRFVGVGVGVGAGAGRERRTRWFEVRAARWQPSGGRLDLETSPSGSGDHGLRERLQPESVAWLVAGAAPCRLRVALRLEPGERVVGFGERFSALDQRGRRIDSVVFEQYKRQGDRTYLPMPFAIVAGGRWGFHVATTRRVWFDIGAREPDRLWVEVDLDPADREPTVALQLFAGSPADVLGAFLARTGAPTRPPDWIFRPWMSGNEWNTQARVLAEVERSEREGIPVGAIVIEAWSDEQTFAAFRDAEYEPHPDGAPHRLSDFSFPADGAWPDPKALVDALHRRGIKVLLWQVPLLKAGAPPGTQARFDWETMRERGYAVRQADGRAYRNRGWWFPRALLPDFTDREAADWWLAKRRYLVDELGIDGFKTDGGEHPWGHDLRYADGTTGAETNNRYPVLYAAAYHRLLDEAGREGITFSRAGSTGAASFPCHWAGDEDSTWEAFRASIVAGLTAGSSGVFFWGWDLAGFSGEIPSAELYLRAAAMACFCPIMQYHSEFNHHRRLSRDRAPWNIAERTGEARVIPIYRRFARLRERLVPYLAEQGTRSIEQSKPLLRPLFFDVEGDETIWRFPLQYFLGDDLLVSPVTEPGVTRWQVYLPRGEWVDAWSGETMPGGRVVERVAPLDEIPVYIRSRGVGLRSAFDPL